MTEMNPPYEINACMVTPVLHIYVADVNVFPENKPYNDKSCSYLQLSLTVYGFRSSLDRRIIPAVTRKGFLSSEQ